MQKMQIILDEEKIRREAIYSFEKMQDAVDSVAVDQYGLRKASDGFYVGEGNASDYTPFMCSIQKLKKLDWFVDNVKTWLWFNSDSSNNPDDFAIDDIKAHYSSKRAMA